MILSSALLLGPAACLGSAALFLASAQLLGVPAALAIASTYPLWSAFAGWAFLGQSVGPAGLLGVLLAAATSLFWALNTFAIARRGADLPVAGVNTFRMGFAIALMPLARLLLRGRGTSLLVPGAEMRRSWPFFPLESVVGTALFLIGRERIRGRVLLGIVVVPAGIVLLVAFGR